jgi:hypothetical protein
MKRIISLPFFGSCQLCIFWPFFDLPFFIKNSMTRDLAIIVMRNLLFIGLYQKNTNVIHLFVLFEHWYCAHCLNTNVICLFVLFKHGCCMFIRVVYTRKSYTWLSCLNNAQCLCLTNTNLWNNKFHTNLE